MPIEDYLNNDMQQQQSLPQWTPEDFDTDLDKNWEKLKSKIPYQKVISDPIQRDAYFKMIGTKDTGQDLSYNRYLVGLKKIAADETNVQYGHFNQDENKPISQPIQQPVSQFGNPPFAGVIRTPSGGEVRAYHTPTPEDYEQGFQNKWDEQTAQNIERNAKIWGGADAYKEHLREQYDAQVGATGETTGYGSWVKDDKKRRIIDDMISKNVGKFDKGSINEVYKAKTVREAQNLINDYLNKPEVGSPFEEDTEEYKNAKYIAENNIPPSEWLKLYTGLGKIARGKPRMLSTVLEINPDYKWKESTYDFVKGRAEAQQLGHYSEDVSGARAGASGAVQSSKDNQRKIDGANAGMVLLSPALNDNGEVDESKMKDLTPTNLGELFISAARTINPTGQFSDAQLNEVRQATLIGDFARANQYLGGILPIAPTTKATLDNLNHLLRREGKQAQYARDMALTGKGQDFNYDVLDNYNQPSIKSKTNNNLLNAFQQYKQMKGK